MSTSSLLFFVAPFVLGAIANHLCRPAEEHAEPKTSGSKVPARTSTGGGRSVDEIIADEARGSSTGPAMASAPTGLPVHASSAPFMAYEANIPAPVKATTVASGFAATDPVLATAISIHRSNAFVERERERRELQTHITPDDVPGALPLGFDISQECNPLPC